MSKRLRVIAWGTGLVGSAGLKAIIAHPRLELVGLYAYSADKIGRDAGELVGLPDVGVKATADIETLIALNADCLAYFANARQRVADATAEMAAFLRSGTNVVTTSLLDLVFPDFSDPTSKTPIENACRAGGTSFFASGTNPGYCTAGLPLSLLSVSGRIKQIRLQEIVDMSSYRAGNIEEIFGFGKSPGYVPLLLSQGIILSWYGSIIKFLAQRIDCKLQGIEIIHDTDVLDYDIDCAFGRIPAGTVSAVHFGLAGMYRGRALLQFDLFYSLNPAAGRKWDVTIDRGICGYRVLIDGTPSFTADVKFPLADGAAAVALHVVNAIPAICAGPSGIAGPTDHPFYAMGAID